LNCQQEQQQKTSWTKSATTYIAMKGPKEFVAESLANALADFFIVDPSAIETKLIRNAGITLKDVRLKAIILPIHERLSAKINGSVQEVKFSWSWGRDDEGGSDWVKNVTLDIIGLHFVAKLSSEMAQPSSIDAKGEEEASSSTKSGIALYIENQVQRILDSLTLTIQDFEFRIELPGSNESVAAASLVLGGSALELLSFGWTDNQHLKQTLSLGSIHLNIMSSAKDEEAIASYPLLEKVAYKATCTRTAGKRFSGVDKGLHVIGESSDDGIVIHAGAIQMGFVNELGGLILATAVMKDDGEEIAANDKHDSPVSALNSTSSSSTFELPMSAVSIVLPNGVKVSLAGLNVKYRFDGTILQVEGREGVLVDKFPVLSLGETSLWCADVVHSTFSLADPTSVNDEVTDVVAFFHGRTNEIDHVMQGIDQVMGIYSASKDSGALGVITASLDQENSPPAEAEGTSWSARIDGAVALLWEGSEQDSAEAVLRGIVLTLKTTVMLTIQCIDSIYVPGIIRLISPIKESVLNFNGSIAHLALGEIEAELLIDEEGPTKEKKENPKTNDEGAKPFSLPVGIRLSFESMRLKKPDDSSFANLTGLVLSLSPDSPDEVDNSGIALSVHFDDINHDMIRLVNPNLAAVIHTETFEIIHSFALGVDVITVAAGYTVLDWRRLVGRDKKSPKKNRQSAKRSNSRSPSFRLPFAFVEKVKIKFAVNGVVGMKESTQNIPAYHGDETTTSDDLITYYATKVAVNTPGLISNTEVLGVGVTDAAVGHYGSVFGATVMSGLGKAAGPAGGILSVAAFDGIRNTMKAGKESRGAAYDDSWKASDFVSGLAYSAKQATKGGAAKRGKAAHDNRNIVDWTVGATSDIVDYTDENKSRLGAAGAGTFGFIFGAALAGPVGGMAGAVIVSAVTGKTITTLENFGKKNSKPIEGKGRGSSKELSEGVEYSIEEHRRNREISEEEGFEMEIDSHPPPLQGVLAKRRNFFKWDWKTHFFSLEEGQLKYYNFSERSSSETDGLLQSKGEKAGYSYNMHIDDVAGPRKSLVLQGLTIEADDTESTPDDNLFIFTLNTPGKKDSLWVLGAPNMSNRAKWIARLRQEASRETRNFSGEFLDNRTGEPQKEIGGQNEIGIAMKVDLDPHPLRLTGILAKRRDFFVWDWRIHFFTLEDFELKYYTVSDISPSGSTCTHQDSSGFRDAIYVDDTIGPRKTLNLHGLSVEADDEMSKPMENLFVFNIYAIGRKGTVWCLGAPSECIRAKWIAELTKSMQ